MNTEEKTPANNEELTEKESERANRLAKAFRSLPMFDRKTKNGRTKPVKHSKERAKSSRHTDHNKILKKRQKKNKKNKKK